MQRTCGVSKSLVHTAEMVFGQSPSIPCWSRRPFPSELWFPYNCQATLNPRHNHPRYLSLGSALIPATLQLLFQTFSPQPITLLHAISLRPRIKPAPAILTTVASFCTVQTPLQGLISFCNKISSRYLLLTARRFGQLSLLLRLSSLSHLRRNTFVTASTILDKGPSVAASIYISTS